MWEQVKMPNRHFLRSDIFTFVMVYSFYFRLFPLMNQIVTFFNFAKDANIFFRPTLSKSTETS